MGDKGIQIIELDAKMVVKTLNSLFCDEWLAYYQYWVGAQVAKGPMRPSVIAELVEHAGDELRHAQMLSDRIIQLGGVPVLEPKQWYDYSHCGYARPDDHNVKALLVQNIEGEKCAIGAYKKLIELTKDKDLVTHNIASEILSDEVEHEDDLQALLEDIRMGSEIHGF